MGVRLLGPHPRVIDMNCDCFQNYVGKCQVAGGGTSDVAFLATCWLWFALMQIAREPCIPLSFLFSHRRWRQVPVKGSKTPNIIHPLVATRVISNSKKGVRSNLYLATNTSLLKEISMVSDSVRRLVSLTNSRKLRKTSKNKQAGPTNFTAAHQLPAAVASPLARTRLRDPQYLPEPVYPPHPTCNLSHWHAKSSSMQAGRSLELGRPRRTYKLAWTKRGRV
jgi:hypothetical protein